MLASPLPIHASTFNRQVPQPWTFILRLVSLRVIGLNKTLQNLSSLATTSPVYVHIQFDMTKPTVTSSIECPLNKKR